MTLSIKDLASNILKGIEKAEVKKINLTEYIIKYFSERGYSKLEAFSISVKITNKLKSELKRKIEYCQRNCIIPTFEFDEVNDDIIYDYKIGGSIDEKEIKILRYQYELKNAINKLTWREFEALGILVLEVNGVNNCNLAPPTNEGGLDAFGILTADNVISNSRIWTDFSAGVILQCKSRPNGIVSSKDMSEFVIDMNNIKNRKGLAINHLPDYYYDSLMPLTFIVITNGDFQKKAADIANANKIIIWNGDQIVQDLIIHPDFDNWLDKSLSISELKLKKYLNRYVK